MNPRNDRYQLQGDTMLIYHRSGQIDVMVREPGAVYTLTCRGVDKHVIEEDAHG